MTNLGLQLSRRSCEKSENIHVISLHQFLLGMVVLFPILALYGHHTPHTPHLVDKRGIIISLLQSGYFIRIVCKKTNSSNNYVGTSTKELDMNRENQQAG